MEKIHTRQDEGSTLIEILIATIVFVVVLGLSLALASSFSQFEGKADADSSAQLDAHRAFSRIESVLRQGWSAPVILDEGEALQVDVLGYSWDQQSGQWDQVDPATWRREYDLSIGEYYFVDSSGYEIPVATCTVRWDRLSSDLQNEDYHFGNISCSISDDQGHSSSWLLATRIGTHQLDGSGSNRLPGLSFDQQGQAIVVELQLQRNPEEIPYSIKSRVKRRNFLEDAQ
ncbi:MAG: hypothetical protein AAEJ04_05210 [Planctomycetota bacterium]